MEDNLDVSSILSHSREAAVLRSAGVVGSPDLAGGILLGTSLLGLLTIILAFWYQRSNLSVFKGTYIMSLFCRSMSLTSIQVVHSSLVFLLTMDALNLIATIVFGTEFIRSSCNGVINCSYVEIVWFLSRWFGVILHLQNASLSIHHLCQPQSGASLSSVYSLIALVIVIVVPLYLYVSISVAIFILAAFIFLFALTVIGRSTASTMSPSTATLKKLIAIVAMCNFLVVYIPAFILQCLLYSTDDYDQLDTYQNVYSNVLFFTNCHLGFDGLLCALILKLPSGEQKGQQQQQWQQMQQQQPQQQQWQQMQLQQPQQQQWQQQQQQWQQMQLQQPQQQQWQQMQLQQPQQQQWQQQQQQWQHQLQELRQQQWQPQQQQQQQQQWQQQQWQQQQLGYL